jgi:hypothetical protein
VIDWEPVFWLAIYHAMMKQNAEDITKEKLVLIIAELLKTDIDLGFLRELKKGDLEKLVASVRDRIDHQGK